VPVWLGLQLRPSPGDPARFANPHGPSFRSLGLQVEPGRAGFPYAPSAAFTGKDPLPTARATAAIAQLCGHLTATQTDYPGTDLILRYEAKTRP
jgi:hypothetical protein